MKVKNGPRNRSYRKRYVHVSITDVYVSCSGFVGEDFSFNPSTPYGLSPAAADKNLRNLRAAYDSPAVTTRAATVYGSWQQLYRITPLTILFILPGKKLQLHGGGLSIRPFFHVRDVCDATYKVMSFELDGGTYRISTNEVISIRDLVARICSKLGVNFDGHLEAVEERVGKDSAYHFDHIKVRAQLGLQDHIALDQGRDECIG